MWLYQMILANGDGGVFCFVFLCNDSFFCAYYFVEENNMYDRYPFELKPLPYAYNALEPYIDEKTMYLHHDKHLQTYINNLNAALKDCPGFWHLSLEQLLCCSCRFPEKIRTAVLHNGGGVYNHNLYFAGLSGYRKRLETHGSLWEAIIAQFGSFDAFKSAFKNQALNVFGSGYTWLVLNRERKLEIVNTANQDTILPLNLCLIMLIDVWEHAYYLKNYNIRADYIENWFNIINWELAETNYQKYK